MTSTAEDVCQENSLRAIQNEYIVEHLFSFLSVSNIKNCRLTNRTWMKIATKILRRRTHVLFDYSIMLKNQLKEISDYCKENTPENTPISSFAFKGGIEYFQLINFLDDVRSYSKELKIEARIFHKEYEENEINLAVEYGKITADISPQIAPHLTKLHMEPNRFTIITLSLCLDQISFVKDIYLDNCKIVVDTTKKRLTPNNITLGPDNKYIRNGAEVKFLVNESFNLSLTKRINLNNKSLIIDFSDFANDQVERTVTLKDINVRSWEKCNWKIKKFSLDGVPFICKNFIEMEELIVNNLQLDLSKIYNPASLLKLHCEEYTTISNAPFFLPTLNDVTFECEDGVSKIPYFTNNKNISKMVLTCKRGPNLPILSLNINDLPKGINELTLTGIEVHGEGVYQLQTLNMLKYFAISKYSTIGAKFRPENFKIFGIDTDEGDMELIIQLLNLENSYDRLFIGYFQWNDTNVLNNSEILNYVDREAACYVFEGKRGRGLTKEEAVREFGFYKYISYFHD